MIIMSTSSGDQHFNPLAITIVFINDQLVKMQKRWSKIWGRDTPVGVLITFLAKCNVDLFLSMLVV